jgi:translation initiation factor IF-1
VGTAAVVETVINPGKPGHEPIPAAEIISLLPLFSPVQFGLGVAAARPLILTSPFPAGLGVVARAENQSQPLALMKEMAVEVEGIVQTVLPGTMFRVQLANAHLVLATISGKMRKRWVRLTVGDRVKMEMSPYDLDKARIVWRLK